MLIRLIALGGRMLPPPPPARPRCVLIDTVSHSVLLIFRTTPVLPEWHVKDPGHSIKSTGGRLHLNNAYTLNPSKPEWADYAVFQHSVGTYQETS